jgi:hypothetical protein
VNLFINRCFIATTVLGGKIYVVGGRDGDLRHVMAERYDPATNIWTLLPSLPAAVSDTAVTTLNGIIKCVNHKAVTEIEHQHSIKR